MPLKNKKMLVGVGGGIAGVVLVILIYMLISFISTSGVKAPIESMLEAMRTEDYVLAYTYTSPRFQQATSLDNFKAFIEQNSGLRNNDTMTYLSKEVKNDEGAVKGILISRGGLETLVRYKLVKYQGKWKIDSMVLTINKINPLKTSAVSTLTTSSTTTSQQAINTPATGKAINLANNYDNSRYRFSIRYPMGWTYTQPSRSVVVFNGEGEDSRSSLTLQAIKQGRDSHSVQKILDEEMQIISKQYQDLRVVETGKLPSFPGANAGYQGRYVLFHYTANHTDIAHLSVVYFKKPERALYLLDFVTAANQFDADVPTAKAMITSFTAD